MTVHSSQFTTFFSLKACLLLFKEEKSVLSSVRLEKKNQQTQSNPQSLDFYTKKIPHKK